MEGTGEVGFQPIGGDAGRYGHIQAVLKRFGYAGLKRADKGLVLRYLGRTTGYSRQQVTRLVRQCLATGGLAKCYRPPARADENDRLGLDHRRFQGRTQDLHRRLRNPGRGADLAQDFRGRPVYVSRRARPD